MQVSYNQVHWARQTKIFDSKIVNIFLYISLTICFGCSEKLSNWDVLLSTHNICFGTETRKWILTLVLLNQDLCFIIDLRFFENTVDPDQMASHEAIWSGYTLFSTLHVNVLINKIMQASEIKIGKEYTSPLHKYIQHDKG